MIAGRQQGQLIQIGLSPADAEQLRQTAKEQERVISALKSQGIILLLTELSFYLTDVFAVDRLNDAAAAQSLQAAPASPLTQWAAAKQADTIDKRIMKNLLSQFFLAPAGQRRDEILNVVTSVLEFSDDDKRKIGMLLDESGLWRRRRSHAVDPSQQQQQSAPADTVR